MWREYLWRNKQIGHLAGWKSLLLFFTQNFLVQKLHQNNMFTKNAVFSVFVDMK